MPFTWVNTALGNIKTALAGTYHHVSAKHAQRYLTSFAWRFNRRYQLDTLTERCMSRIIRFSFEPNAGPVAAEVGRCHTVARLPT